MLEDVTITDVRKRKAGIKYEDIEGKVIKYTVYSDELFLNLDTGHEIRIKIKAIADAISEIISKEILDRLAGR